MAQYSRRRLPWGQGLALAADLAGTARAGVACSTTRVRDAGEGRDCAGGDAGLAGGAGGWTGVAGRRRCNQVRIRANMLIPFRHPCADRR